MKRLIPAAGVVALALFPAGALASPSRAKVLSVNRHHHTVELVDAAHAVHAYRYHGTLPRLGLGDTVTYRRAGRSITHLKKIARAFGTMSFYAKVVRAGTGQVRLRLDDGSAYSLSSKQISKTAMAHAATVSARSVTLQVLGLRPGETVLISETVDARGDWTVTITLSGSATSAGGEGSGGGSTPGGDSTDDQDAEGTIITADPAHQLFAGVTAGDEVDVTYHQSAGGDVVDGVDDQTSDH